MHNHFKKEVLNAVDFWKGLCHYPEKNTSKNSEKCSNWSWYKYPRIGKVIKKRRKKGIKWIHVVLYYLMKYHYPGKSKKLAYDKISDKVIEYEDLGYVVNVNMLPCISFYDYCPSQKLETSNSLFFTRDSVWNCTLLHLRRNCDWDFEHDIDEFFPTFK